MTEFSFSYTSASNRKLGLTIAMFLWLVGLSGMGFFLNFWIRQKNFVYVLTVSGILGTLLVAKPSGTHAELADCPLQCSVSRFV